ncbi:MAG: DJ-1/PfpI family protein [Coriobacteriia bacterium]|nr:DJ-1/PfpI family protein [Coriobacteriia bacterium]
MADVLMVIAPDQFRDEEYAVPKDILEERGARVVTGSVAPGPCRGKLGLMAMADVGLDEVDHADYDAVVFVGGAGSNVFFDDVVAHALVRAAHDSGRILGAICIAPSILAHAGILRGRRVTSFPSQREDLEAHGAVVTDAPVEVDGRIVTACGPEAAHDFGTALADALGLP